MKRLTLLSGLLAAAVAGAAFAQTYPPAQVQAVGPTDLFQDVVGGNGSVPSQYASALLLGNYGAAQPGNNSENLLIGGDATTNLWQRATTGSSVTTAVTYGGPDRWAYWSGTSTAMTVSRDATAADLPASGYKYGFKMARTSGQSGVVQMCMMQEVESANSYALQGQTAEIDFWAYPGANFSAASNVLKVYLITGTGADEGTVNAAFGLNAGGGGASAWTGQVNTAVNVTLLSGAVGRYSVAVPFPATSTEAAVALCYTPVGTAGTNDFVTFAGIQLTRNSALASVAGSSGAALNPNDTRAKAFAQRPLEIETGLQQRYLYTLAEPATAIGVGVVGHSASTTTCVTTFPFPVTMRTAPTFTALGTALSTATWKINSGASSTALASTFYVTTTGNTLSAAYGTWTIGAAALTAGDACIPIGANGGSVLSWSAEL